MTAGLKKKWFSLLKALGLAESTPLRAARHAFQKDHPAYTVHKTSLRATEEQRFIVRVCYREPGAWRTRCRLYAVNWDYTRARPLAPEEEAAYGGGA